MIDSHRLRASTHDDAVDQLDDLDALGSGIATVLRAAKESAAEIIAEAEAERRRARQEAARLRDEAAREADALRAMASTVVGDARAEADRMLAETAARVQEMVDGADVRVRDRLAEIRDHEAAVRARLNEANEELQLALIVVNDGVADEPGCADHAETHA